MVKVCVNMDTRGLSYRTIAFFLLLVTIHIFSIEIRCNAPLSDIECAIEEISDEQLQQDLLLVVSEKMHNEEVQELVVCFWRDKPINFGDELSPIIIERLVGQSIQLLPRKKGVGGIKKLLGIGSIMRFAATGDVIWGTGVSGKSLNPKHFKFEWLDVRAVRGPLTRDFLKKHFNIDVPEVYGDPALLFPHLFPEFKKKKNPKYSYIVIPHFRDIKLFPRDMYDNVVYPSEPWNVVIEKILDSEFVISGSLHGIVIAEAFGIPARLLRITSEEHIFKYIDYYLGTGRPYFRPAFSVLEALALGGEPPIDCDLQKLYEAFPFEFWPDVNFQVPNFDKHFEECI